MDAEKPTKEEVIGAMSTLSDIMLFVASRGLWNKADKDVVKLTTWLRQEFGYTNEEVKEYRRSNGP